MDFILNYWQWILGAIVGLAIIGAILGKLEERKLLKEWNRLIAEKGRFETEIDALVEKRNNEDSEPERAKLWLEFYKLRLEDSKNDLEIAKLRIAIIKKEFDEEKREKFRSIYESMDTEYAIQYANLGRAEEYYKSAIEKVNVAEQDVQKQEQENLFYQCKKCNTPYAREEISNKWLDVEYLGSECELEYEEIEETVEDTESITKKAEQQNTTRRHRIKMHKIYQCKHCDDKTDEIQANTFSSDFWCCPECAKDDVIKEIQTTELGQYKTYKKVTEENSRGKNTKQVSITKVREQTNYECSNCGHQFSRINSRELR